MPEQKRTRRAVLGTGTAALTVGLSGCLNVVGNPLSNDSESEESDDEDTESEADDPLPYTDDFESGNLDAYDVVSFPGDDGTQSYYITEEPSRGEYAVRHQTETEYLTPSDEVPLSPPVTFSMDFYVSGWSGTDIALQYDEATNLTYLAKVRNNNSGRFIELLKVEDEFTNADSSTLINDRNENSAFATEEWETVTIDWGIDGTMTAEIDSTGESVSITDNELSGNPFHLVGYHYYGWAAFDNIEIE